jgi:hypothetical protein
VTRARRRDPQPAGNAGPARRRHGGDLPAGARGKVAMDREDPPGDGVHRCALRGHRPCSGTSWRDGRRAGRPKRHGRSAREEAGCDTGERHDPSSLLRSSGGPGKS